MSLNAELVCFCTYCHLCHSLPKTKMNYFDKATCVQTSVFGDKCLIKANRKPSDKATRTSLTLIYYVLVVWHACSVLRKCFISYFPKLSDQILNMFENKTSSCPHLSTDCSAANFRQPDRSYSWLTYGWFPSSDQLLERFRINDQTGIITRCAKNLD